MTNPEQKVNLSTKDGLVSQRADPVRIPASVSEDAVARQDIDRGLVMRVQAGDASAFGELIDRHQRSVYGIVSRMVASRDEADDLVQDVFVAAYGSIGQFRGDAKFSTWLHTITVNTTLKRLKYMKRRQAVSIDDPMTGLAAMMRAEGEPTPAGSLEERELNDAVRKAIDSLPDKQRIVVVMHYFEQYSCEEIASVLKCSIGTVWSRLHYACKKLKGELRWLEQGT